MSIKIGCVLMASGYSSRFGENKLNINVNDKTLISHALECIENESLQKIVVISQYDEIKTEAENMGFHFIKNDHPELGISNTIKLGLTYTKDCDATMFMVSDQPMLKKESVNKLLSFYRNNQSYIVRLGHKGKMGNPCVFPATYYDELLALSGDIGGNAVIREHKENLKVLEVTHHTELLDIDTKEDLINLLNTEV